jgi:hypothetical protein
MRPSEFFALSLLFGASRAFASRAADIFKLAQKTHLTAAANRRLHSQSPLAVSRQSTLDGTSSYRSKFLNSASHSKSRAMCLLNSMNSDDLQNLLSMVQHCPILTSTSVNRMLVSFPFLMHQMKRGNYFSGKIEP